VPVLTVFGQVFKVPQIAGVIAGQVVEFVSGRQAGHGFNAIGQDVGIRLLADAAHRSAFTGACCIGVAGQFVVPLSSYGITAAVRVVAGAQGMNVFPIYFFRNV
jgi:hypothetical protein